MPSRRPPPPSGRPGTRPPAPGPRGRAPDGGTRTERPPRPLGPREIDELQRLLDGVPGPLEPLDVVMLDGFLCGVLLQPVAVPTARWWPQVTDVDARPLPAGFDAKRLRDLVLLRHDELDRAIRERRWFDPWVFELEDETDAVSGQAGAAGAAVHVDETGHGGPARHAPDNTDNDTDTDPAADAADDSGFDAEAAAASDAVYPWVAGLASALETFPGLMASSDDALTEPLALLYRHLDPDDLEDADELLEAIDQLGPPADIADAVEGLVRAVLLLADVTRPRVGPSR